VRQVLANLANVTQAKAQPLDKSILLKVSLDTRLDSESFKTSIDFLACLVQKL